LSKERLRQLVQSGDYVLLLGAGFSKDCGCPLWNESLVELAGKLAPHDKLYPELIKWEAQNERFLVAAEQLYLAPVPAMIRTRLLQEVFGREGPITARQKRLVRSPCQGIVTTNFDRNVERAAREASVDMVSFTETDADLPQARVCDRRFSVRLHGRIESPEGLIFSRSQYDVAKARPEYQEFFREIFVNRNVIFFGFSFADPLIASHIGTMSSAVHAIFKREAFALFPSMPSGPLTDLLREAGITPVVYDPGDRHDEGWRLLIAEVGARVVPRAEDYRANWVRNELAAVYARARSRSDNVDRVQIMAGLLTSLLPVLGIGSEHTVDAFEARARQFLALPDSLPRRELAEAIKRLERDGLLRLGDDKVQVLAIGELTALSKDLASLVDGLVARAEIRYEFEVAPKDRPIVAELLTAVLVVNGLHIAHSFIRRRPLTEMNLKDCLDHAAQLVRLPDSLKDPAFTVAVMHFLTHPDPGEERLLNELAHLAFATSLMVVDPVLSSSLNSETGPSVYLDTSVLLPWISEGHPLQQMYSRVIAALGRSKCLVIPGYVNELVSHKRLAREAIKDGGLEDPERFARYVMMFEASGINTYLGGFSCLRASGYGGTIDDYLATYVPFETEAEAAAFLRGKGISVLDSTPPKPIPGGPLFGELKAAFVDRHKERPELVIEHDCNNWN
jgi:hypothetical protein